MFKFSIRLINYLLGYGLAHVALICVGERWKNLHKDLLNQIISLGELSNDDVGFLSETLVVCEDVRFFEHSGVDLYAIARASTRFVLKESIEGASTITQQLVRVYTKDYRFEIGRKLREILLATLVDKHFSKQDQIRLYLHRAYFGWRMNGLSQALARLKYSFPLSPEQSAEISARLKYPEPEFPSKQRKQQIAFRVEFILETLKKRGS